MNVLGKTEAQKDFVSRGLSYGLISEGGKPELITTGERHQLEEFADLQRQFPYTHSIFKQTIARQRFTPGKTYAIWFRLEDRDLPDICFAITINSTRGQQEFGRLPLH